MSICELCDYYRVKQKSGKSASVALKTSLGPNGIFCAFAQFFAAIGAAHFLADLRNAALSAFEEGAPSMGTALAAYKQCIGAEVVCIFT